MPKAEKSMGVIGTVVATVAGAAFLGLWGMFAPPTNELRILILAGWGWILGALAAIWNGFNYPLPIPAWALACLVLLIAWLWTRRQRAPVEVAPVELTTEQNHMLSILVVADGVPIRIEVLCTALGVRVLEGQRTTEALATLRFVAIVGGNSVELLPRGRDYALDHHLLGSPDHEQRLREAIEHHRLDWMRGRI